MSKITNLLVTALDNATLAFYNYQQTFLSCRKPRWRMQAKNGRNSKERRRDQVRLKGRRCKKH